MLSEWFGTELQEDLNKISTRMKMPAGTILIEEDSKNGYAYVVLEGKVRAWALCDPHIEDSTQTVLLEDIEAVNIIGEISAIDGKPQSATVESITDTIVLRLSSSHVLELMEKHAKFERHILSRLCNQLRTANEKIRDMRVLSSEARITREILRMSEPVEDNETSDQNIIQDFPTHSILAARCGVRRETVSRAVGRLIKDAHLKRVGKSMIILDNKTLLSAYHKRQGDKLC